MALNSTVGFSSLWDIWRDDIKSKMETQISQSTKLNKTDQRKVKTLGRHKHCVNSPCLQCTWVAQFLMKAYSVHLRLEGCRLEISSRQETAGKAVHLRRPRTVHHCWQIQKKIKNTYSTKQATPDKLRVMWLGSEITNHYHKGHRACGLLENTECAAILNVQLTSGEIWVLKLH